MRGNKPEQALQIAVANYLRVALRPPTIWSAFPAGGGGRVRGAFLKAMGLQAGWPDILIFGPKAGYPRSRLIGLELKSGKGRQSPEQKEFQAAFETIDGIYGVARSVDEVEGFLRGVGIPLHATVSARAA